ncbi:hypothetical protein KJ652_02745 [Patescibacteria group bacterium]|nr:hypothetical protein [Patescibacteria group bacterium]MBU1123484.1 hypothetical protein [Patescibacteria group bacterium]MBU1911452.1 hypothetical protein [Patescibacteria group bacterium]
MEISSAQVIAVDEEPPLIQESAGHAVIIDEGVLDTCVGQDVGTGTTDKTDEHLVACNQAISSVHGLLDHHRFIKIAIVNPYELHATGGHHKLLEALERRPQTTECISRLLRHEKDNEAMETVKGFFRNEILAVLESLIPEVKNSIRMKVCELIRSVHDQDIAEVIISEGFISTPA